MSTRVINIKAAPSGWENDPQYVYIGRAGHGFTGEWGNPFNTGTREDKLRRYEAWMRERLETELTLPRRIAALRGKTLVCFCAPLPCHGDVLARLAEEVSR
jgi:hypothetical protein